MDPLPPAHGHLVVFLDKPLQILQFLLERLVGSFFVPPVLDGPQTRVASLRFGLEWGLHVSFYLVEDPNGACSAYVDHQDCCPFCAGGETSDKYRNGDKRHERDQAPAFPTGNPCGTCRRDVGCQASVVRGRRRPRPGDGADLSPAGLYIEACVAVGNCIAQKEQDSGAAFNGTPGTA